MTTPGAQVPLEQGGDGGLARTRGTSQGDVLSGGDRQAGPLQDRGTLRVREGHVFQADLAGLGRLRGGLDPLNVHDGRNLSVKLLDFLVGGDAAHADVEELTDAVQRIKHDRGEQHKGDGPADAQRPLLVADEGQRDRAGDHTQGKDGIDDEEDQLIASQVAHDLRAHLFGGISQALPHVLARVHEGQVAQALDRVEFLGGQLTRGVTIA